LPSAWFFCVNPQGFYPYVKKCIYDWKPVQIAPPPRDSSTPPFLQGWAYCYDLKAYYPYVKTCADSWELVEVSTPPEIELSDRPTWYFCGDTKTYFPYASNCSEQWEKVPAMPPSNTLGFEKQQQIGAPLGRAVIGGEIYSRDHGIGDKFRAGK